MIFSKTLLNPLYKGDMHEMESITRHKSCCVTSSHRGTREDRVSDERPYIIKLGYRDVNSVQ